MNNFRLIPELSGMITFMFTLTGQTVYEIQVNDFYDDHCSVATFTNRLRLSTIRQY